MGLNLQVNEQVNGLSYIEDYISISEEKELIEIVDGQTWLTELKRRVQHYGYKYAYKSRSIDTSLYLGDLPEWLANLAGRLRDEGLTPQLPDQVIINEYQPGQGIAAHVDCVPCFGETIISLSLGGACVMAFTNTETRVKVPVLLASRSLVIFQGEARYKWQHGIAARKKDKYQGQELIRSRRVSLTFRKVLNIQSDMG